MSRLNNNEIGELIDLELGKEDIKSRINKMKESAREQDSSEGEKFSIDKFSYNFRTISDAKDLKEGTSYSEHMLDLNELMAKGVLQRGNKIDLSDMPEIETIQAATQEQLDMLTPESKKQITAIHLSNDTPVGWDDNYDFDNKYSMDEKLDLSSYKNVTEVQSHFYVNNDLQDIVMPEKATELLCRHSKMENLQKDGGLQDVKIVLDRAETAFDAVYDSEDAWYNEEQSKYHNEQKKDGTYALYYEETPVLEGLKEPAKVEPINDWRDIYNEDFHGRAKINDKTYLMKYEDDGLKFYSQEGASERVGENCDKISLVNSLDNNKKFDVLRSYSDSWNGLTANYNEEAGVARTSGRRDVGRGMTPQSVTLYAKKDGKIFSVVGYDSWKSSNVMGISAFLYSGFLNMADKEGIKISEEQTKALKQAVRDSWETHNAEYYISIDKKDLQLNDNKVHLYDSRDKDKLRPEAVAMFDDIAKEMFSDAKKQWNRLTPEEKLASAMLDEYQHCSSEALTSILDEGVDFNKNRELATKCLRKEVKEYEDWNVSEHIKKAEILIERGARFGDEKGFDEFGKRLEDYTNSTKILTAMRLAKINDAQKHRDELAGVKAEHKAAASTKPTNQATLSVQGMKNAKDGLAK
ncbi:MAG: hypothetical protein IJ218_04745 [Alphaproteobacteria bacterium]|nr:hypothetical protein [Alphaproteobacteria bacterium]